MKCKLEKEMKEKPIVKIENRKMSNSMIENNQLHDDFVLKEKENFENMEYIFKYEDCQDKLIE